MRQKQVYKSPKAAMLWSIALPGFGQLYNKDYITAVLLLVLEFLVNYNSNLNLAIFYSFHGNITLAHEVIDYRWGLFYPSIYAFSIWQAYNHAKVLNYKVEANGPLKRTYCTGFFFGMVIGMNFGLYWHNHLLFEKIKYLRLLHFPVFYGLLLGVLGGILGFAIESAFRKKERA